MAGASHSQVMLILAVDGLLGHYLLLRNLSFFDYDLDEGDLFGDLFWEAPADVDSVSLVSAGMEK